MINTDTVKTDINLEAATHAYHGTSFRPEKRGASVVNSYIKTMEGLARFIEQSAKDDRQKDVMQEVFDDLRLKYKAKTLACLDAQSRCMSSMITGPANFPVRRAEKANNAEHKRTVEWLEFHKNLEKYALKNLNAVYSTQEKQTSELEKQRSKLKGLIDSQELMKQINAQYRKGGWDAVTGIADDMKEKLVAAMASDWRSSPKPFETYVLTNNNANIKRIKKRIAELETKSKAAQEHGTLEQELNGLTICRNYTEDRLQLLFSDIPSAEVRKVLKSHGFRWSPRFSAWQRKLTNNALYVLKNILLKKPEFNEFMS